MNGLEFGLSRVELFPPLKCCMIINLKFKILSSYNTSLIHIPGHYQLHTVEIIDHHFLQLSVLIPQVQQCFTLPVDTWIEDTPDTLFESPWDTKLTILHLQLKLFGDW